MYINSVKTSEKATRSTQIMKDVKLALQEMLTSLDKDWNKRNEALSDLIRRIEGITSLIK